MKKILRKVKKIMIKVWGLILRLPIFKINNKKIIFDNFNGKGFGDNPKYIALELIKENVDCEMIWLVNNIKEEMPAKIKKVKYGSFKSYYELATAKVWIDNVRNYKGVEKKKNQFYIQTWHGSVGFKKCEKYVENTLPKQYIKEAKNDGRITDIMLSDSKFITNVFRESFWYNGIIKEVGFPKNDILYNVPLNLKEKVCNYFGFDCSKKIVIYAPTFRKNGKEDNIKFNYYKCCEILKEKFGEEFVILIRLHPNDIKYAKLINYDEKVKNATTYPDVQELIAVADIGITDYSSIAFDLARVGKKVFLLCKDYEDYLKNERDLFFDMNELPFLISFTEEELYENIKMFSEKDYNKKCIDFYNRDDIKMIKTMQSSFNTVEIIKKEIS